ETTVVTSVIGDTVTITGVVARYLSDEVITLEGVVLEAQPAEELLVIIPETLEPQGGTLDEGALVAVEGVIFQVTNERLADIDRSIFDEHGELLEGFRSAWGIAATDVRAAEDGE